MAKKVLIVEDDQSLREVFELIVKSGGYDVEVAADGEEGLKKLADFEPDVVLLDMLMPVKSGLEFLQESHIKKSHPHTTVFILSNLSESQTIEEALRLGATKHLIKSDLNPQDLLKVLDAQLQIQ